jgi:hypothetical protein
MTWERSGLVKTGLLPHGTRGQSTAARPGLEYLRWGERLSAAQQVEI